MKIKPIVIGLAVSLLLPLAGANARSISDPGRNLSGSSADLLSAVVQTDENYSRKSKKGSKGKCSKGSKGSNKPKSKSPSKPPKDCEDKKSKKSKKSKKQD